MPKISLAAARINANLTQKQAAEALNVSLSTYKNWENGITYPKQPAIEKICELYGMPYDYIRFN
jgi:transcriptional regulator with XRE-family HTH domain